MTRPWPAALAILLAACQPPALHQGGVVFVAPPGGVSVAGRLEPVAGSAVGAPATLRLVGASGTLAEARAQADGAFRLDHVPAGAGPLVAALHVELGDRRGFVEHASGGEARRRWVPFRPGDVHDLGLVRLAAGGATASANPLERLDHDGDGLVDASDLDDDGDGMGDHHDADDLNLGVRDDHDPLGDVASR